MQLRNLPWEVLLLFGGVQTVLTALVGYLGKLWLERTLQSEKAKLEALLEKSIYVQKVQFDTEFKIYSDLWKAVCVVREAIIAAQIKITEQDRRVRNTPRQEDVEASRQLDSKLLEFKGLVENNRPFFAADIAKLCIELTNLAEEMKRKYMSDLRSAEANAVQEGSRDPLLDAIRIGAAQGRKMREFLDRLTAKTDEICEAIRGRLTGSAIT